MTRSRRELLQIREPLTSHSSVFPTAVITMVATVIADGSITELLLLAAGIGGTGTTTALVITRNQLEGSSVRALVAT